MYEETVKVTTCIGNPEIETEPRLWLRKPQRKQLEICKLLPHFSANSKILLLTCIVQYTIWASNRCSIPNLS